MFKITGKVIIAIALLTTVSACSTNTREALGIKRKAPDEFKVLSHAPLSVPPEFSLRPIAGDKITGKDVTINGKEGRAVFEKAAAEISTERTSKAENAFLQNANASNANPRIKEILKRDATFTKEEKGGLLKKLAFFRSDEKKETSVINASAERERILKNKQDNKPSIEGKVETTSQKDDGVLTDIIGF